MLSLKYLASQLYDGFILLALFFAFTAICLSTTHGVAIPPASRWYQVSLLAIFLMYYLLSICYGGKTIGMRAWHLVIITEQGNPSLLQAIMRLILLIPAALGALIKWENPQKLLLRWTKTELVSADNCR
ncbi:RDD family protein [Legionella tunisiensis]|uniref:RDD family protein n=1 Tax=Legionella tunisiensis TaxID=1034944 RepID=UPI000319112F|nr:RDD family protein [Legionella tunisiensis]